jgi:hypothetical protein
MPRTESWLFDKSVGSWFENMSQTHAMKAGSLPNENSLMNANVDDQSEM